MGAEPLSAAAAMPFHVRRPTRPAATAAPRALLLADEAIAALLIFLMTGIFGGAVTAVEIAFGFLFFALNRRALLRTVVNAAWLMLPLFAVLSCLWSTAPSTTLRYGLLLLFTCMTGAVIARALSPRAFVRAVLFAEFAFCLISLATRITAPSIDGVVLVGLTGSKNAMAAAASLLFVAGLCAAADRRQPGPVRLLAIPCALPGLYIVATNHSATAFITTALSVVLVVGLVFAQRLPRSWRLPLLLGIASLAMPAVIAREAIAQSSLAVLHKDPTLTGRTWLWARADELIAQKPLIGYGYRSVMNARQTTGIAILRWAGITDPRTFSFHNTFLEVKVDLGYAGFALLVLTFASFWLTAGWRALYGMSVPRIFLFAVMSAMFLRAFSDTMIGGIFVPTLIIFAIGAYSMPEIFTSRQASAGAARER